MTRARPFAVPAQRTRKPRLPKPTERVVQREIVRGLRQIGLRVIAIPNGGQYSGDAEARYRMAMAKRMDGEVAGFPDLLIMSAKGPSRFGLLEIKRPGAAKNTDHVKRQLEVHDSLRSDGHRVAVVDTFEDAYAAVREWGLTT